MLFNEAAGRTPRIASRVNELPWQLRGEPAARSMRPRGVPRGNRKKDDRDDSNGPRRQRDSRVRIIGLARHRTPRTRQGEADRGASMRPRGVPRGNRPQGRGGRPGRRAGAEYVGADGSRHRLTRRTRRRPRRAVRTGGAVALDVWRRSISFNEAAGRTPRNALGAAAAHPERRRAGRRVAHRAGHGWRRSSAFCGPSSDCR